MATTHWRKGYSVEDLYTQADAGWSFHQLVHLLLGMHVSEEVLLETLTAKMYFTANKSPSLPAGEIRQVLPATKASAITNSKAKTEEKTRRQQSKAKVECAHYNLTGLDGPLAEPFFDMMYQDLRIGKGAMAAFIDLFNNRIHALRYLVHAYTNINYTNSGASENEIGKFLLALSGHYYPEQRQLCEMKDNDLLSLTGHLGNSRMTLPTIRKLFITVLDLPVISMKSLIGRWLSIEEQDYCLLGRSNQRLGSHAVLGKKVWDQQAAIELELGPVDPTRASELVPGGRLHHTLHNVLTWVSEKRVDCWISLICSPNPTLAQNATQLSYMANLTNRLGYGAALTSKKNTVKRIRFLLRLVS